MASNANVWLTNAIMRHVYDSWLGILGRPILDDVNVEDPLGRNMTEIQIPIIGVAASFQPCHPCALYAKTFGQIGPMTQIATFFHRYIDSKTDRSFVEAAPSRPTLVCAV